MTDAGTFEDRYLSGAELYGDDFDLDQIEEWFETEREGYANLETGEPGEDGPGYSYHALNWWHGFRHLPKGRTFPRALGLGSAYGEEFQPVAPLIGDLTILEPSDQLVGDAVGGVVPRYVKPLASGDMPFDDDSFDLILCFGTLHHIPNVSHVVQEMGRVLAPGGFALIREPIVSMGDWRRYRGTGCTEKERGIPRRILTDAVEKAGLRVERLSYSGFPVTLRLGRPLGTPTFNSKALTILDAAAARVFLPAYRYHVEARWQKLRPTSAMLVTTKP